MKIISFTFNPFQENTYLLLNDNKECIIVDPGCYNKSEQEELEEYIQTNDLKVTHLLNTHAHIDHVFGNKWAVDTYQVKLALHKKDEGILRMAAVSAKQYGLDYTESPAPEIELIEGEYIDFGPEQLEVVFVPGHSPGHVVFIHHNSKSIIGGDVLFQRSIGRTDLPGGNHDDLIRNIQMKLFVLADDYRVYPGHGPSTTIGEEKRSNPFF